MDQLSEDLEPGPNLSKFFTYNENSIQAMSDPYLWFSTLGAFNDPFEGSVEISTEFDPKDWWSTADIIGSSHPENSGFALIAKAMKSQNRSGAYENKDVFVRSLTTRLKQSLARHGYCCFFKEHEVTETSDILMWGHYGNGLRGFKVVFDSQELISSLPITTVRAPVKYGLELPAFDILDYAQSSATALSRAGKAFSSIPLTAHLRTKHEAWAYEKEYRFISPETGAHKFAATSIKEVIFGEKMPSSQQKVLQSVISANSPNTVFKSASVSKTSYGLVIR